MKKGSAHISYHQEFHGEAKSEQNYKKDNAYINAQKKRRIRNIFKHIKQIEKPKIRAEKRVMLAKFCRFVVPEHQYYWMYQDLSLDDVRLTK